MELRKNIEEAPVIDTVPSLTQVKTTFFATNSSQLRPPSENTLKFK
jgi:hypothetical protein